MKIIFLFATLAYTLALRFDGDQVLTLHPITKDHLSLIREFEELYDIADFWSPEDASAVKLFKSVDIRFVRSSLPMIIRKLNNAGMQYTVKINNLQELVDGQFNMPNIKSSADYNYNKYHSYDEIQQWINDIAADFPGLARASYFATSYEKRNVNMLTLGTSDQNPVFLIDCGVHAREWIAPAWCTNFVYRMVSQYDNDPIVKNMMDTITWMIIPLYNVDGYVYSWETDRMWRKTRSDVRTGGCVGVDANRNFDKNWSGEGASANPCSSTYYGPRVESEPIVFALSEIIRSQPNILGYIAFHSYTQVFVFPYSYDYVNTHNHDELMDLSSRASAAIKAKTGSDYTWGPGHQSMYLVSGGSKDMAFDNGIPLSWTIELRDTGEYGFLLPENQIAGTSEEMFEAMIVLADEVNFMWFSKNNN